MMRRLALLLLWILLAASVPAARVTLTITVDGTERKALVYPGRHAEFSPSPLVLAFHGYGGNDKQMSSVDLQTAWPEATVVYPQGLIVTGRTTGRKEPGWQQALGESDDRDLAFVDALVAELRTRYKVDDHRVYATGMSNGALFCYVLLTARPHLFAAFAPVAGASTLMSKAETPRPLLIIQGKNDTTMPLAWAQWTLDYARKLNGCGKQTTEWGPGYLSYQPCDTGNPVIWHLHDGGHIWPDDATEYIVRFFKEHQLTDVDLYHLLW